jgi:hypothetical protein
VSAVRLVKPEKAPFTPEQVAWIEREIERRASRERTAFRRFLMGLRRLVLSVTADMESD